MIRNWIKERVVEDSTHQGIIVAAAAVAGAGFVAIVAGVVG